MIWNILNLSAVALIAYFLGDQRGYTRGSRDEANRPLPYHDR